MAWTPPTTRSTGDLITASIWNTDLVANLSYIITGGLLNIGAVGAHTLTGGANSGQQFKVVNTTSGTAAYAQHYASAGTNTFEIDTYSQGYTTTGSSIAASTLIYAGGAGGLTLQAADAAGVIRFYSGGATMRWGYNAAGDLTFGASSHIADAAATPTRNTGFGTSPSITGAVYAHVINVGTGGVATNGVVDFNMTFSSAPCVVACSDGVGIQSIGPVTTTGYTITNINPTTGAAGAWASGTKIFVLVRGV